MACDLIKVGLYQESFQRMLGLCCFETDIQEKTMRLFVFKIKALYFFSQLLCSTVLEHDKHMITMLNNQMEDICFQSIRADKRKTKI